MKHSVFGHHLLLGFHPCEGEIGVGIGQLHLHLGVIVPAPGSLRIRLGTQPESGLPEELTAGEAEVVETAYPDEVFDGRPLQGRRGPAQEVG